MHDHMQNQSGPQIGTLESGTKRVIATRYYKPGRRVKSRTHRGFTCVPSRSRTAVDFATSVDFTWENGSTILRTIVTSLQHQVILRRYQLVQSDGRKYAVDTSNWAIQFPVSSLPHLNETR